MIDQQEFQFSRACDYKDADNVDENCSGKIKHVFIKLKTEKLMATFEQNDVE